MAKTAAHQATGNPVPSAQPALSVWSPGPRIRRATANDATACADLLGTALVYRGPGEITRLIDGHGLVLMALDGAELVAVGTAEVLEGVASAFPQGNEELEAHYDGIHPLGVVRQLVTIPRAQGAGIASRMVGLHLEWMASEHVSTVVCDAWVYPDGRVPAAGPLLSNGFARVERIEGFWKHDPQTLAHGCTVCGTPCACAADIFERSARERST